MKITWLTQGGVYLETQGLSIMVDPYLSDYVGKVEGKWRRIPVDEKAFDLAPDVMIFTHDHIDHYDPETAPRFLQKDKKMLVLSSSSAHKLAAANKNGHNYVRFAPGTEWTEGDVHFTAVTAVHSDPQAIGVLIKSEGKTVYITGDTLYSRRILQELPEKIDLIVLPVNGAGNNVNMTDGARLCHDCGAKMAMPVHVGLFDDLRAEDFPFEPKLIPQPFVPIQL